VKRKINLRSLLVEVKVGVEVREVDVVVADKEQLKFITLFVTVK
jgi:hypothetical protein